MIGHLVQSTVFALVAVAICLILKNQRAALRHVVLLAAMLRFLIPTPWLAKAGGKLASCLPSPVLSLPVADDVARLLRRPGRLPARARPSSVDVSGERGGMVVGGGCVSVSRIVAARSGEEDS